MLDLSKGHDDKDLLGQLSLLGEISGDVGAEATLDALAYGTDMSRKFYFEGRSREYFAERADQADEDKSEGSWEHSLCGL